MLNTGGKKGEGDAGRTGGQVEPSAQVLFKRDAQRAKNKWQGSKQADRHETHWIFEGPDNYHGNPLELVDPSFPEREKAVLPETVQPSRLLAWPEKEQVIDHEGGDPCGSG